MLWIAAAIFSYVLNALVYVADKFLLSKKIHSSAAYAFYVGIWSIFNLAILVFDPWLPDWREFLLDISAGILFLFTLIFWYKALHQSEATRVVPIVGALVPIFSLLLSAFFLKESLNKTQLLALLILIAGGILISVKRTKFYFLKQVWEKIRATLGNLLGGIHARYRPTRRLLLNSLVSAFFFAAYYVLIKYIYLHQPFIGGFVWSRLGTFIGALLILFFPRWRRLIIKHKKGAAKIKNLSFFLLVRLTAALAFIVFNWAISLGNVALVNSLQGAQYLFLLIIVLFLSARFPKILKEEVGREVVIQKIIGIILVITGLYILLA